MLAPLGNTKWHNNFVIVPKPNVTICLCLDPARLNQALIRPEHTGPTIYYIPPKLTNEYYVTIIDANSGSTTWNVISKAACLTIFACQFGRYCSIRLLIGVAPTGKILKQRIDEIIKKPYQMCLVLQMKF